MNSTSISGLTSGTQLRSHCEHADKNKLSNTLTKLELREDGVPECGSLHPQRLVGFSVQWKALPGALLHLKSIKLLFPLVAAASPAIIRSQVAE